MLMGHTSRTQLFFDYPYWKEAFENYQPDSTAREEIRHLARPMEIKLYYGTWCGDSRRNVPRFLKIMDGLDAFKITMVAVDRDLDANNGEPGRWDIQRVPTFIFFEKGKEIGRIVENPKKTLEKDIIAIIKEQAHE